jgi:hypothetical protein
VRKAAEAPDRNDYVFVVAKLEYGGYDVAARQIFACLTAAKRWLLPSYACYARALRRGDRVLIYIAGPRERVFTADAVLAAGVREMNQQDRQIAAELRLLDFEQAVDFDRISLWTVPVPLSPLTTSLRFIRDKRYPGQYLRHGVVRLEPGDFDVAVKARRVRRNPG